MNYVTVNRISINNSKIQFHTNWRMRYEGYVIIYKIMVINDGNMVFFMYYFCSFCRNLNME